MHIFSEAFVSDELSAPSIAADILVTLAVNKLFPAAQGADGPPGPAGAPGASAPSLFSGRFFDEVNPPSIFVSSTGNDATGNGLTLATGYATVQRALQDLPQWWTADVFIRIGPGTFAGNQTWTLAVLPGTKANRTQTGRVMITGDVSTPLEPLTGGAAGTLNAGTLSMYTFNVGAYTTVVGNGTHFTYLPSSVFGTWTARALSASTSPNLVAQASTTTALAAGTGLYTWTTIFSGTITINTPAFAGPAALWFFVAGIRFGASLAKGVQFFGCREDAASTSYNCARTNHTFFAGTQTIAGHVPASTTVSTSLVVNGSISVDRGTCMGTFFATALLGTATLDAKLCGGGTGGSHVNATQPAYISQFGSVDFISTAALSSGIRWIGGSITSTGLIGAATFNLSGANSYSILLDNNASIFGATNWAFTGTCTLGAFLYDGGCLMCHAGYNVTNSAVPGGDIYVGSLAQQAVAVRPTTDSLVQGCRYN